MTINMRRKKIRITPGKALMLLFFAWFILACLVLPNLNLLKTVFFADGNFSTEPIRKLLKSKRAGEVGYHLARRDVGGRS